MKRIEKITRKIEKLTDGIAEKKRAISNYINDIYNEVDFEEIARLNKEILVSEREIVFLNREVQIHSFDYSYIS